MLDRNALEQILNELFAVKKLPCPICKGTKEYTYGNYTSSCSFPDCKDGYVIVGAPVVTEESIAQVLDKYLPNKVVEETQKPKVEKHNVGINIQRNIV